MPSAVAKPKGNNNYPWILRRFITHIAHESGKIDIRTKLRKANGLTDLAELCDKEGISGKCFDEYLETFFKLTI